MNKGSINKLHLFTESHSQTDNFEINHSKDDDNEKCKSSEDLNKGATTTKIDNLECSVDELYLFTQSNHQTADDEGTHIIVNKGTTQNIHHQSQ